MDAELRRGTVVEVVVFCLKRLLQSSTLNTLPVVLAPHSLTKVESLYTRTIMYARIRRPAERTPSRVSLYFGASEFRAACHSGTSG